MDYAHSALADTAAEEVVGDCSARHLHASRSISAGVLRAAAYDDQVTPSQTAWPITTVCGPVGTVCAVAWSKPASRYIVSSSLNV